MIIERPVLGRILRVATLKGIFPPFISYHLFATFNSFPSIQNLAITIIIIIIIITTFQSTFERISRQNIFARNNITREMDFRFLRRGVYGVSSRQFLTTFPPSRT